MHSPNLKCSLGCNSDEDQRHIFEQCKVKKSHVHMELYDHIFHDSTKQKEAISVFLILEERRKEWLVQPADLGVGTRPWLCHGEACFLAASLPPHSSNHLQPGWEPMAVPWGGLLHSSLTPTPLTHTSSSSRGPGPKGQRSNPTWRASSQDHCSD